MTQQLVFEHEVRDRLRALATRRGTSYASLSRLIGRPRDYLSRYLAGRAAPPSPADRELLAAFLGVPPVQLGGSVDA